MWESAASHRAPEARMTKLPRAAASAAGTKVRPKRNQKSDQRGGKRIGEQVAAGGSDQMSQPGSAGVGEKTGSPRAPSAR
jgi:hypothetical protein